MERVLIEDSELPKTVYSAFYTLIVSSPDMAVYEGAVGMGWHGYLYMQDTSVNSCVNYCFELKDKEDDIPKVTVAFVYNSKADSINKVYFRFFGEKKSDYIEIETGLYGEISCSDEYPDWWNYTTVNRATIQLEGKEVFDWCSKEHVPAVLKKTFGISDCSMEAVLEHFINTEQVEKDFKVYSGPFFGVSKEDEKYVIKTMKVDEKVVNTTVVNNILKQFEDKVIKSSEDVLDEEYSEYPVNLRKYAELINDDDYKIEPALLSQIMRELIPWCRLRERARQFEMDSEQYMEELFRLNIPNLALLGEPGTGKTTLAKRLAEKVLGAEFLCITGADLKGRYIGHTKGTVIQNFIKLREKAKEDSKPAILFIDEAYNLFNNEDDFGAEAIEILLKAMEPGKRKLEGVVSKNETQIEICLNENTAVWLGGYEKDMRKALSVNKGMYRRVKTVTLPVPNTDSMIDNFKELMRKGDFLLDDEICEANYQFCDSQIKVIREYFTWARSKTYAEFFGNYAGVKKLVEEIVKYSLLKGRALNELNNDLEDIIERQKAEIRTQYKQVIEAKYDRVPFLIYTDVEDTFADYIGADAAKNKLKHVIEMVCSPEIYPNCSAVKGALLMGPPGTGKTFLAKCMAGELRRAVSEKNLQKDVAFVKVAATELCTAELVKALFMATEGYDYVILFIDEIDAIGKKRELLNSPSVLIQLLNEMDGFEGKSNVFVLAATNAPEVLDDALKRPGRFDMSIEIGNPNDEDRRKIVRHYLNKIKCSDETVSKIAKHFGGYSPVEIKTIINESLILYYDCKNNISENLTLQNWFAHRVDREEGKNSITLQDGTKVLVAEKELDEELLILDFLEVMARRRVGERSGSNKATEGFSLEKNDISLSSTAIHEVGHALVSILHNRIFEKITILQRGAVLGYVEQDAETRMITKQDYLNRIDICFGGRAAEELIYGSEQISSGASSDINTASKLARYMIMQVGMSDNIGPIALENSSGLYLGGNNRSLCTEDTMTMAEEEVRKLLKKRYAATFEMLKPYTNLIKELAEYVYQQEELSGEEFLEMFNDKMY